MMPVLSSELDPKHSWVSGEKNIDFLSSFSISCISCPPFWFVPYITRRGPSGHLTLVHVEPAESRGPSAIISFGLKSKSVTCVHTNGRTASNGPLDVLM